MVRKFFLAAVLGLAAAQAWAQGEIPAGNATATPSPTPVDPKAAPAWDDWFKRNTTATDKGSYVVFLWNAQDCKAYFGVPDKKVRLAEAAVQLACRMYPAGATADPLKVDIVYFLERDNYGMPKWDSLQKVAHFEFPRSRALKQAKSKTPLAADALKSFFTRIEFY